MDPYVLVRESHSVAVDYGETHALKHKHARYGRHYPRGQYASWSKDDPLHFLGHSIGGPTLTTLVVLLRTGFFGEDAHPDMVASVTGGTQKTLI